MTSPATKSAMNFRQSAKILSMLLMRSWLVESERTLPDQGMLKMQNQRCGSDKSIPSRRLARSAYAANGASSDHSRPQARGHAGSRRIPRMRTGIPAIANSRFLTSITTTDFWASKHKKKNNDFHSWLLSVFKAWSNHANHLPSLQSSAQ